MATDAAAKRPGRLRAWLRTRRGKWIVGLGVVVALGALNRLRGATPEVEVAPVTRGPLVLSLAASGRVDGVSGDLSFADTGKLVELYVDEGDSFSEGQILARIEPGIEMGRAAGAVDVIRAPYDGWVVQVYQREGVVVAQGQPVLRVTRRGPTWVTAYIDSEDAAYLKVGDRARCRAGGYLAEPWDLEVAAIGREAVPREDVPGSARQVRVRMRVVEAGFGLRPGTPVDVDGEVTMLDDALLVPAPAVVRNGAGAFVWRLEGRIVRRVEVRTGPSNFRQVAVERGLNEGDLVVVSGKDELSEGALVRTRRAEIAEP